MWTYAREHDFTVVSKDADFAEISMLRGFPPKLLWLRIGNCQTSEIEQLIRANQQFLAELAADDARGILGAGTAPGQPAGRRRAQPYTAPRTAASLSANRLGS